HNIAASMMDSKDDSTNVTWAMPGPTPYMAKVIHVFVSMDSLVAKQFEAGLANLNASAETWERKTCRPAAASASAHNEPPCLPSVFGGCYDAAPMLTVEEQTQVAPPAVTGGREPRGYLIIREGANGFH